jgi:hypothetical protein
MSNRKFLLAGGMFMLLATVSIACGPSFPQAFLPHRAELLKAPIKGDFAFELSRYSPAIRARTAAPQSQTDQSFEALRDKADAIGITLEQHRQVRRMRQAKDGDAAYIIGQGLPETIRLYTAAAVDYHLTKAAGCARIAQQGRTNGPVEAGQTPCMRAIRRFESVLSLPEAARRARATWAAYSLAEMHFNSKLDGRHARASKYYELVRALVKQGNPDPLDLASSSLGQQAFLRLDAGDTAGAITLYLAQGDINSLREVAERLVSQPDKLESELKAQPVRRLLIAYVFAYAASEHYIREPQGLVNHLAKSLIASNAGGSEDMDRLAAISYEHGNFQQAAQLAERSETPLAHWVKSKLVRRNGNNAKAAKHLAMAIADRNALRNSLPAAARDMLGTESAAAMLEKGIPKAAIARLYAMGGKRWPDIAYIAERLLTTEELRTFVDGIPAETAQTAQPADIQGLTENQLAARYGYRTTGMSSGDLEALDAPQQLRNLLARRLMREGRHKAALSYFAVSNRQIIDRARDYATALRLARHTQIRIAKANTLFKAGALARKHGLEILGYELAPDFHYTRGNYVSDYVLDVYEPNGLSSVIYGKATMSLAEARRFNASAPMIDKRHHYRYLAVKHGLDAANLLPPRSQAYRAVLCHATSWAPEEGLKKDLYRTYVRNGSMMNFPLSSLFGRKCEVPDFEQANHRPSNLKGVSK